MGRAGSTWEEGGQATPERQVAERPEGKPCSAARRMHVAGTEDSMTDEKMQARLELGEPGLLRVAIAVSAAGGAFWGLPGIDGGEPRGVSVDLARDFARRLGLTLKLVVYPNSDAITIAAAANAWDVTLIPYDSERAQ